MVTIIQYPDTIVIAYSGESVQNGFGDWVPVVGGTVTSDCRYEPNSGDGVINTTDGQVINFSGIVYLPFNAPRVKEGSRVTVTEKRIGQTDYTHTDIVKRFSRGQLNCRIWV